MKSLPQTLMFFRGCSGAVEEEQKEWEEELLRGVVTRIGAKVKLAFTPTIIYIEVDRQKDI